MNKNNSEIIFAVLFLPRKQRYSFSKARPFLLCRQSQGLSAKKCSVGKTGLIFLPLLASPDMITN